MTAPTAVDELLKAAKEGFKSGDFAQAISLFEQVLTQEKANLEAHEGLAMARFASKDYAGAAAGFVRLTQLKPMDGRAWVNLGAVYNRLQEYQKATEACRKAIQRDRKSAEAQYNLGLAFKGLNQPSMAVSAYREALKLNSKMPEAHANLANVLVDMKNYQQAISHYKQALEINPEFDRARRGLEFAEDCLNTAKSAASPFGRLVDEKNVGLVRSHAMQRKLTEDERAEDRFRLFSLCPELEATATQLVHHLRSDLEKRLLLLNRMLAQGSEARSLLLQAAEDFRLSLLRLEELRRALHRKVIELRAHEELVCMPSLTQ